MSKSYKHTRIFGNTYADTEQEDKRIANRKYRHKVRQEVEKIDTEESSLPILREVSDVWGFDKDGKQYYKKATEKDMRK